jgi:hypothetical protein
MTEHDLNAMLAEIPIDGLEAHYRSYTDDQTALYRRLAEERGLLISCGSDSHAPKHPVDPRPWRAKWCQDLLMRLGIPVAATPDGQPAWRPGMDTAQATAAPATAQPESPGEQVMEAEAELARADAQS